MCDSPAGVPAHPGGTILDLKDAKPGQTNLVAVQEMLGGERHQGTQCRFSLLFREIVALRHLGGHLFKRDRGLRCGLG
jgi:hypothetical protein